MRCAIDPTAPAPKNSAEQHVDADVKRREQRRRPSRTSHGRKKISMKIDSSLTGAQTHAIAISP